MQCKSLWIKASAKCINVNVNVTRLAETAQAGPRGPQAYPQRGSEVECRDAARGALFARRPVAGSECAVQHLPSSTVGQGVQERLW